MARDSTPSETSDLDRHMPFQRRTWAAERVGWGLMGATILAALAGIFSDGPLSAAQIGDAAAGLRLQYQRFERYQAPATLRIGALGEGGTASLRFDQAFLDSVRVLRIVPEPVESIGGAAGHTFRFRVAVPGEGLTVLVFFEPERPGTLRGEVALPGRPPLRFTQWVYP